VVIHRAKCALERMAFALWHATHSHCFPSLHFVVAVDPGGDLFAKFSRFIAHVRSLSAFVLRNRFAAPTVHGPF
jgi:hypothetical protein